MSGLVACNIILEDSNSNPGGIGLYMKCNTYHALMIAKCK